MIKQFVIKICNDIPLTVHEIDAIILRSFRIETMQKHRELVSSKKHMNRKMLKLLNGPKFKNNCYKVGKVVFAEKRAKVRKLIHLMMDLSLFIKLMIKMFG
jgi:hypothetical protein